MRDVPPAVYALSAERGATFWLTGLPAAGKSTIAAAFARRLSAAGVATLHLDGDTVRGGLCQDLGFGRADRAENARRVAHVAVLLADAGLFPLVALVSPYTADRALARAIHGLAGVTFFEVFVDTPVDECERRDPRGLYAAARRGEVTGLTGVDAPYEVPAAADLVLAGLSVHAAVDLLWTLVPRPGSSG